MEEKDLKKMKLHESKWLIKGFLEVFRVPGGWIYCWHWDTKENPSQVFVPEPDPWAEVSKSAIPKK